MKENTPSATALRVAMRRAAHQVLDRPPVFEDPLALRIVGLEGPGAGPADPRAFRSSPVDRALRAFLAARSRYAEDRFAAAMETGVGQYVVLGAGLDTFAYRRGPALPDLKIFEVDFPATQAWKRERLEAAGIPTPPNLTFVPIDFSRETLPERLREAGVDTAAPAFFSWLGVTPYLLEGVIMRNLEFVAGLPRNSEIVFDYARRRDTMNLVEKIFYDRFAARVAAAGEPWLSGFVPSALARALRDLGFGQVENLGQKELNERYFPGRKDGLKVGGLAHVMGAQV